MQAKSSMKKFIVLLFSAVALTATANQVQVEVVKANLNKAYNTLKSADNDVTAYYNQAAQNVADSEAAVPRAKANLDKAQSDYNNNPVAKEQANWQHHTSEIDRIGKLGWLEKAANAPLLAIETTAAGVSLAALNAAKVFHGKEFDQQARNLAAAKAAYAAAQAAPGAARAEEAAAKTACNDFLAFSAEVKQWCENCFTQLNGLAVVPQATHANVKGNCDAYLTQAKAKLPAARATACDGYFV